MPISLVRLAFLSCIAALAAMGIFAKRGWIDWRRMVKSNDEIAVKVSEALAQKEALDKQMAALQANAQQQEAVVRQTLGYVRPQELVIEFP